jgi:hypothetical protein
MRHLTPAELLDLADGTRPASAVPHLASCPVCERQLSDLLAAMALAAGAEAPEPSPLFWDHLQQRVHDAVAAEQSRRRFNWTTTVAGWRLAAALAAAAAVVWTVAAGLRTDPSPPPDVLADGVPALDLVLPPLEDDAALTALAEMTAELDWAAASEAGLLPARGAIDRVVLALDEQERIALGEILEEVLAGKGA